MFIVTNTRPTLTAVNYVPSGGSQPSHHTDASRQQNGQPGGVYLYGIWDLQVLLFAYLHNVDLS